MFLMHTIATALSNLRAYLTRWFFSGFFRLLLVVASLAEWGMLCWLFADTMQSLPWVVHVVGPGVLYATNRWTTLRTRRRLLEGKPAGAVPQLYYAVAFTCLFCFGFLLASYALWITAKVSLGALIVEARTTHAGLVLDTGVDTSFRWLTNAGVAVIALSFGYGYSIGQSRLRVARLGLPLRHATPALDGLRIVQISDIHIGQNLESRQLERFVTQVNALQPDLICITGDIVDGPLADIDGFLPILAGLRAARGVFAILGNHDHYAGADRIETILRRRTPFTILRDQCTVIQVNDQPLHIIGLDDRGRDWARGVPAVPYLDSALAAIPDDEPVLLLCHRPDIFTHAAARGVGLTLSGHTHGGQIAMPWFKGRVRNLAEFVTPFDRGLFQRNGSYLYVNCGLGVTGQRIRLCTPREITLITVEHAGRTSLAA